MSKMYAPSFPIEFDSKYSFQNVKSMKELIKFHLTNLLLTYPGEKISDPSYGVGIKRYLFEQLTPDTKLKIQSDVSLAISRYLRYLNRVSVEVKESSQRDNLGPNAIIVQVVYSIKNTKIKDVLSIDISMPADTSDQSYS